MAVDYDKKKVVFYKRDLSGQETEILAQFEIEKMLENGTDFAIVAYI